MDKADIEKLFELAKIKVTSEELERFPREFNAILEYAKKLKEAPLGALPPTLSMAPRKNVFREDESRDPENEMTALLVDQFPELKEGYLKTKNVFGNK
jgi:aspartyl-tRNA(Asn)/glutamyl-tRNA(Gln) amidotransferase subunit C